MAEFDAWTAKNLGGINDQLKAKAQPPIELLTRAAWEKQGTEEGGGGGGATETGRDRFRERD